MKIRTDFVSNSSSSSFIIKTNEQVQFACNILIQLANTISIPYIFEDSINIKLYAKNKNYQSLLKLIYNEYDNNYESTLYIPEWKKPNPDDICYDSIDISSIAKFQDLSCDAIKLIESIEFISYDSTELGCLYLKLLYLFFQRHNIYVDISDSEHIDFLCQNSFIGVLSTKKFDINKRI